MDFMIKALLAFLVSVVGFLMSMPPFPIYLLILDFVILLVFLCFYKNSNVFLFRALLGCAMGNGTAFLIMTKMKDGTLDISGVHMTLLIILAFFAIIIVIYSLSPSDLFIPNAPKLYKEHAADLERMKYLLKVTDILGINAIWGNGKSFVVDYFCNEAETRKDYEIIRMGALEYSPEEFDYVLIQKLDQILRRNHIFSIFSLELQQTMKQTIWGQLAYYLFRGTDSSQVSAYDGLKKELQHVSKKVLIVYEDVERVKNPVVVKKIFAVGERLAGPRVKIIYEYDGKQLDDQELTRKYREKYIPIEMNLTGISYRNLVEDLWDELGMEEVNYDSRRGTRTGLRENILRIEQFAATNPYPLPIQSSFRITDYNISVRTMRTYLLEIKAYLLSNQDLEHSMLRPVVVFYFIKNFILRIYDKLKVGISLESTFPIFLGNEKYTLFELADEVQQNKIKLNLVDEALQEPLNHDSYLVLCLFNYNLNACRNITVVRTANSTEGKRQIVWLHEKERIVRIDSLISNLLENGETRISNVKICVDRLKKEVLSKSEKEQDKAWQEYKKALYHNKLYRDSRRFFLPGPNYFVVLAHAIATVPMSQIELNSFFDFVDKHWEGNQLDDDVIEFCETLLIRDVKFYKDVVRFFLKFTDIQKLTFDNLYKSFLKDFQRYFGLFLGIHLNIEGAFIESESVLKTKEGIEKTIGQLKNMIEVLKEYRKICSIDLFLEDVKLYINFLQRNIEILQKQEEYIDKKQNKQHQDIRCMGTRRIEELMRILKEEVNPCKDENDFISRVNDCYKKREINAGDIILLQSKLNQWKTARQKS